MALRRDTGISLAGLVGGALLVVALFASPEKAAALDYDCADFSNQAQAQQYLLPGDPYNLDADPDGIACEALPCPCSSGGGGGGGAPSEPAKRLRVKGKVTHVS